MGLWPSNKRLSTLSLFTPALSFLFLFCFIFIFQSAKHGENCGGCGVRCSAVIDSKLKLNKQYTENERARVNEMWGVNDTLSSRFRRRISNKFVPMVAVSDPFSFHPFLLFSPFFPFRQFARLPTSTSPSPECKRLKRTFFFTTNTTFKYMRKKWLNYTCKCTLSNFI